MAADDDQTQDYNESFRNSWVGRVLRGEEELTAPEDRPQQKDPVPQFSESAYMRADGIIEVHVKVFDRPDDAAGRSYGNYEAAPTHQKYQLLLRRHADLKPGEGSTFERFFDGRWVLSSAVRGILSNGDASNDPEAGSETQERRAAG